MRIIEYITFDDVVIVPRKAPVDPQYVVLESNITRNHRISVPILSSPMDTVTEQDLAIEIARLGGVGVIHRNMSISEQADMIQSVKSASPDFKHLFDIISINELDKSYLRSDKPLIITSNSSPIGVYIPAKSLSPALAEKIDLVLRLLRTGLVKPSQDNNGKLLVGAAISPFDTERAEALEKAGADFLVTDVAHLHNVEALSALKKLAEKVSIDIVAGNIGTKEAVLDILTTVESISGLRVGISSGSICSTGVVAGASVPTLTAVMNTREALEELGLFGRIPIIADGGIRGPGEAAKAIVAGASAVMSGRLFAGTDEAPSLLVRIGDKLYKTYRGMASAGAMKRRHAADRYSRPSKQLEEGVEGLVPYEGPLVKVMSRMFFGLQASLGYAGASRIEEAWNGVLARVSPLGAKEINPHDLVK